MPFGTTRIWAKNSVEVIGLLIAVPGAKIAGEVPLQTMVPGQWVLRLMVCPFLLKEFSAGRSS